MPNTLTIAGPGVLYGTRTDASGTTPCNFGKVKSVDIEFARNTKPLTGQFQMPIDFAGGIIKATAKAKVAEISPLAMMNLFFGVSSATGSTLTQFLEAAAVPATPGPYTYVVAHPTGFSGPLEVLYAATGLPLQQVPSAPAAGQYSVNTGTGTLTFAAADQGAAVLISYNYTVVTGVNLTLTNQLQGFTPTFSAVFYATKNGKQITRTLPFCTSEKLALGHKEDDFMNPEFDFLIGANAAGQWLVENYPQLS